MVRGGGITNAMDTLVRPGKPIPPGASAIHHIIDEDVQDAPPLSEVIDGSGAPTSMSPTTANLSELLRRPGHRAGPMDLHLQMRAARLARASMVTAIRSCATPSAGRRPSQASNAARSHPTAPPST